MNALVKLGGVSAVVGGALVVAEEIVNPFLGYPETGPGDLAMSVLYGLHVPLFLFAVLGLHLRQQRQAGMLGLVGFVLTAVGSMFLAGIVWTDLFMFPAVEGVAPQLADEPTATMVLGFVLSIAFYVVGWLVLAIATLRARVVPRPAAVALLVGVAALVASFAEVVPGLLVVFYGAVIWVGLTILREPEPVAAPSAAYAAA